MATTTPPSELFRADVGVGAGALVGGATARSGGGHGGGGDGGSGGGGHAHENGGGPLPSATALAVLVPRDVPVLGGGGPRSNRTSLGQSSDGGRPLLFGNSAELLAEDLPPAWPQVERQGSWDGAASAPGAGRGIDWGAPVNTAGAL